MTEYNADRYRDIHEDEGEDALRAAVQEDIDLLHCFGVSLVGCGPGTQGQIEEDKDIWVSTDGPTWKWLRPLLVELYKHRAAAFQRAKDNADTTGV